jgi:hypothetical protein
VDTAFVVETVCVVANVVVAIGVVEIDAFVWTGCVGVVGISSLLGDLVAGVEIDFFTPGKGGGDEKDDALLVETTKGLGDDSGLLWTFCVATREVVVVVVEVIVVDVEVTDAALLIGDALSEFIFPES